MFDSSILSKWRRMTHCSFNMSGLPGSAEKLSPGTNPEGAVGQRGPMEIVHRSGCGSPQLRSIALMMANKNSYN